jgi:hypothetical protein
MTSILKRLGGLLVSFVTQPLREADFPIVPPGGIQRCPLSDCRLLQLGAHLVIRLGADVAAAWYYCPKCEAAFILCWNKPSDQPSVFIYRRAGKKWTLQSGSRLKLWSYLQVDWLWIERQMVREIRSFLATRYEQLPQRPCPVDAGRMYLRRVAVNEPGVSECIYACPDCHEESTYLLDPDYGWQCVASARRKIDA